MSVEDIKDLALALKSKREEKKALEEELEALNEEIKEIEEHKLNDLLLDNGLSELTIGDVKVKRSETYRGKTSSNNKEDFDFLFDTNNGGAVKQELVVDIANCEDEVVDLLSKANILYSKKYSVHWATMSSIISGLIENGDFSSEDIEKHKIYIQPKIAVKPVKK